MHLASLDKDKKWLSSTLQNSWNSSAIKNIGFEFEIFEITCLWNASFKHVAIILASALFSAIFNDKTTIWFSLKLIFSFPSLLQNLLYISYSVISGIVNLVISDFSIDLTRESRFLNS